MKKVKKYYPGTESLYANTGGWSYGLNSNSGMINPGNQTLKQTTTTSSSTIPTGALPASGDISQLTNPSKKASSGGGFSDLMGGMKGMDIGGMASSLGGSLAMLINANKKQDPTGRPYKTGTNMIKSKKSKLIKYQGGTNATDIIGPGPMDKLKEFTPEQIASFNAYENKRDNDIAINRVNAMGTPVSPLTPRMASLNIPQQAPMSVKPSSVPAPEKLSRRERKQENERQFKMLNRQDAEYMTPRTPMLGGAIPDRKPLIKMAEVPAVGKGPKMFDYHSAEAKGGYARALKGGKRDAKGNLIDMETGLIYKDTKGQYNSQLFKGTGRFQEGAKTISAKPTKQDYLDAAAKMTKAQRKQFHELDAKGVKFKFGNLEYSGLQNKGAAKGGKGAGANAGTPTNTGNAAQTPPQNTKKNTPTPQVEGGGQYSNVDWSGKSGFEWKNPLESIARPLVRIGVGASSKGMRGVGAGLIGELANVVADYTPKGTVNSVANNIQTMADAYNVYKAATGTDLKKLNPKAALQKLKDFWKNKIQMGKELPLTNLGRKSGKLGNTQGFNQNPLQTP